MAEYSRITRRGALIGLALGAPALARSAPPLRIGAIADCQYADQPDQGARLYRHSPDKLREAVAQFNRNNLAFAVHLGDFIDKDWKSYDAVLPIARDLRRPWHFVLGNHEFAVADDKKRLVPARLSMPARYYRFARQGWEFVVLDGNDLSSYAWPDGSPELAASLKRHAARYPDAPLWDGGLGEAQMRWLDTTLAVAEAQNRKAVLFCHFPVWPPNPHNLWNAPEVLALVERHRCVKLWLNGHNHDGNYGTKAGIHYLNLRGMVDTPMTSYATLDLGDDNIIVHGFGREQDFTLPLRA